MLWLIPLTALWFTWELRTASASKVFKHPDFKQTKFYNLNNIAIVELTEDVILSKAIQPIPLQARNILGLHKYPAMISRYGMDKGK